MKKLARLWALLLLLMFSYGCVGVGLLVGAGIGAGAYKYIEGSLGRDYPVGFSKSWEAVNAALEKLKISLSDSMNEGVKGTIYGIRQDGKQVVVKLTDKGQGVTYISIRVGTFGSRDDAERIHNEIAAIEGI